MLPQLGCNREFVPDYTGAHARGLRAMTSIQDGERVTMGNTEPAVCTVAVLTFMRPRDLDELLPLLVAASAGSAESVRVLVIDNDPDAGAAETVASFADVDYLHEPRPGISAARNAALDAVRTELLLFIDDDERPTGGWADAMIATQRAYGSAAVAGPVISEFERTPDPWIVVGGFFDRPRMPTGTEVNAAATNNLLVDVGRVRRHGIRFDEEFGLSGGSDTLFTRALIAAGEKIVWCDEALVVDKVPSARITRTWVLKRYYRNGNSWSRSALRLAPTSGSRALTRVRLTVAGGLRVAVGGSRKLVGAVIRSDRAHARGSKTLERGRGMVAGAWGRVYFEYGRSPGV